MQKDEKARKSILTVRQAKLKAANYCAYQERSQQEMRDKLYAWGLHTPEVEQLIAELILENFLNEERFALAYVSGKFNIKGWGRLKIKQGLQHKRISSRLIKDALLTIEEDVYIEKLRSIIQKKGETITEKDIHKRRYRLAQYAMVKGYENELIFDILNNNDL
ncbi:RecX family transcriptional regulator [Olivibacter sp. SDN3]|uniref:regulatory protein RecX n=1 Tax=Olivibacter sp. SDN3 TaxID=2764720 RepID=UPI00165112B7|nr:regulatory protein RecX [Olivibacter sp. SDN3]QNL49907.1 RecX family transcriptional regulator [Olivibacter sp. SDN3]